jgi:AraC-like DNA-binding protein
LSPVGHDNCDRFGGSGPLRRRRRYRHGDDGRELGTGDQHETTRASVGDGVTGTGLAPAHAAPYRELAAPSHVASHVACLWARSEGTVVVVPDGCADLVWTGSRVIVAGPSLRAFRSGTPPAGTGAAGVRLRVGATAAVFGVPANELLEENLDIVEIWPEARFLAERCAEAGSAEGVLRALVDGLTPRVDRAAAVDPVVGGAIRVFAAPRPRVERRDLGLSPRQLRRRFEAEIGYAPKTLVRVLRLQRFLAAAGSGRTLAEVAHEVGYTDHAHLTRDCRLLTGSTPSELLALGVPGAGDPHLRSLMGGPPASPRNRAGAPRPAGS